MADPYFKPCTCVMTYSLMSVDISVIRRCIVLFDTETLFNFDTALSPITYFTSTFAAGIMSSSSYCVRLSQSPPTGDIASPFSLVVVFSHFLRVA